MTDIILTSKEWKLIIDMYYIAFQKNEASNGYKKLFKKIEVIYDAEKYLETLDDE